MNLPVIISVNFLATKITMDKRWAFHNPKKPSGSLKIPQDLEEHQEVERKKINLL